MINPERENKIAQSISYNSAFAKFIKNKAANILAGKNFDQLPANMQAVAEELIHAFLLNKGDSIGWEDPGANYMVLANALASSGNGMPVNVIAEDGKSVGSVLGYGATHSGVARSLTSWIEQRSFNEYGERRSDITKGLSTSLQTGIVGQYMIDRGGLKEGDVIQTKFDGDADVMRDQINDLKKRGVDMNAEDVQTAMRAQAVLQRKKEFESQDSAINREVRLAENSSIEAQTELKHAIDNGADRETVKKLQAKAVAAQTKLLGALEKRDEQFKNKIGGTYIQGEGDRKGFSVSSEDLENATRAAEGKMGGTFVTADLKKELENVINKNASTVKELSEIFGTNSFSELQTAVKQLGLGSLSSEKDVQEIKKRVSEAKAIALKTNRSVQEVMQEQADVATAFSSILGGRTMDAKTITRIMQGAQQAQTNYENGSGTKTGAQATAEVHQNIQADKNLLAPAAVVIEELKRRGIKDDKEANELIGRFKNAKTREEQLSIAKEIERYGRRMGLGAVMDDPGAQDRDFTANMEWLTSSRAELSMQDDVKSFEISKYTLDEANKTNRYAGRAEEFSKNKKKRDRLIAKKEKAKSSKERREIQAQIDQIGPTDAEEAIREEFQMAVDEFADKYEFIDEARAAYKKGDSEFKKYISNKQEEWRKQGMSEQQIEKATKAVTAVGGWSDNMVTDYKNNVNTSRNIHEKNPALVAASNAYAQTQSVLKDLREQRGEGEGKSFSESIIAGLQSNPDNKRERTEEDNMLRHLERNYFLTDGYINSDALNYGTNGKVGENGHMAAMNINMETGEITNVDALSKNENFMAILEESMNTGEKKYTREELRAMLKDPNKRGDILNALKDKMTYTGEQSNGERGVNKGIGQFILADDAANKEMQKAADTELEEGKKWHLDALGDHLKHVQHNEDGTIKSVTIDGIAYKSKEDAEAAIYDIADRDQEVYDRLIRSINPDENPAAFSRLTRGRSAKMAKSIYNALGNKNSKLYKAINSDTYDANAQEVFGSEEEWRTMSKSMKMLLDDGAHGVKNMGAYRYKQMKEALKTGVDQDKEGESISGRYDANGNADKNLTLSEKLNYISKQAYVGYNQDSGIIKATVKDWYTNNEAVEEQYKFTADGKVMRKDGNGWTTMDIENLRYEEQKALLDAVMEHAENDMRHGHLKETIERRARAMRGEKLKDYEQKNALMRETEDGGFEFYNNWDDYQKRENGTKVSGEDIRKRRESGTKIEEYAAELSSNVTAEDNSSKITNEAINKLAGCVGPDNRLQVSLPESQQKGQS